MRMNPFKTTVGRVSQLISGSWTQRAGRQSLGQRYATWTSATARKHGLRGSGGSGSVWGSGALVKFGLGGAGCGLAGGLVLTLCGGGFVLADADAAQTTRAEGSSVYFPNSFAASTLDGCELSLIGLGIRTVTFVKFHAYTVGLYVHDNIVARQRMVPLKAKEGDLSGDELISAAVEPSMLRMSLRVLSTRSTSINHLRDAWCRLLNKHVSDSKENSTVSSAQAKEDIAEFKKMFPQTTITPDVPLIIHFMSGWRVAVEYDGKLLGEGKVLKSKFICQTLLKGYYGDKEAISPQAKENITLGWKKYIQNL